MCFDSMQATRAVEVAEAIFDALSCGMEPNSALVIEAQDLGLDVEMIHDKVNELYGSDDEEADDYI